MAWVADIRQKFETLFLEVDGVMREETEYVENQLQTVGANIENQMQTMGANIKQFYSELVHDVFPSFSPDSVEGAAPELSPQQNIKTGLTAHESSMVGVDINPKQGLCYTNSLAHPSFVEPVEGEHTDSLSKQKADIDMSEKLISRIIEHAKVEKPFPAKIPVVDDTVEEDSSMTSLFDRAKESDNSNALPSANSVILVESCMCRVSDTGLTSGDAFSAVSIVTPATFVTASVTDSCWAGFELSNEVAESKDYVSIADSVAEGSDDVGAEKSTDGHGIEPVMETTQFSELKLDESCVVVDSNNLCPVCLSAAKIQAYKKKTCEASAKGQESEQEVPGNEYLDLGLNQKKGESSPSSALTRKLESVDDDFCDSDWEII